jgi:5'-nucleotidase
VQDTHALGGAPEQLYLPLAFAEPPPTATSARIERADRVFVNRNLNLSNIEWLGFDMDYTLAIYNQHGLDELSVKLTVGRMIRRGYPRYLKRIPYDLAFPIRGLLVDKRFGNVLKMDRFKAIHKGYHGLKRLSRKELSDLYLDKQVRPNTQRYHWIDTLFALSEVTSYSAIVDTLERHGATLDYAKVFDDVRASIDEAHRDGDFYASVIKNLSYFVERDDALEATLHKFRSAGKKLFLLTNSPWGYTNTLMGHLLDGRRTEYPSWRNYFDVVIVGAQKPLWFREGRAFMERDGDVLKETSRLERGRIYEGGNLRDFEQLLSIRGSSVLYVGDHIYGDILRSKKESAWRTAMIIQELDAEIAAHTACAANITRLRELEASRERLEDELRFYQSRVRHYPKSVEDALGERARLKRAINAIRRELGTIDEEFNRISDQVDVNFHPYWGSLLKEAGEMSIFGVQVATYADVYTRRVSCLRHYSPQQNFRSPRDSMPHEL